MEHQGAVEALSLKRKRSDIDDGESQRSEPRAPGLLPNGGPSGEEGLPTTNGQSADNATMPPGPEDPPRLDRSWRQSASNKSLGVLMDRLAQTCYTDLNVTLAQISEIPISQDAAQVNGVVSHAPQRDSSEASLAKKRLLLKFADDQRDRFTKTLVLSDWARREDDMARLIDIKVWQEKQRSASQMAAYAIDEAKHSMIGFKVPGPNIEGAMEIMATRTASWVPSINYIPPKRLTAKQLLNTLRNMNVILTIRLNLHEELPPHMAVYRIADGRVTFSVPSNRCSAAPSSSQHAHINPSALPESSKCRLSPSHRDSVDFEVDLSVADEDPASPFYFIDIRLLFRPTADFLDDRLRGFLEMSVNEALRTKGLRGCYDFLHNFVLTHKMNILRSQAAELVHSKWFGCIHVQHMRRSLIVQYWAGMPGPKSWFEIGISSGKAQNGKPGKRSTPTLNVRWFRKGTEIIDEPLEFDWHNLDLEKCIMQVIGEHCRGKLMQITGDLRALAPDSTAFDLALSGSDAAPEDLALSLNLPSVRTPLKVRIEPRSGQYCITPAAPATAQSERRLNAEPNIDTARLLAYLLCGVVQAQVGKGTELLGWMPVHNLAHVRYQLEEDVWQRSVYLCSPGWGEEWALRVTFGLNGMRWSIVRLEEDDANDQSAILLKHVSFARELHLGMPCSHSLPPNVHISGYTSSAPKTHTEGSFQNEPGPIGSWSQPRVLSRTALMEIQMLAVAEVSFTVLSQQLRSLRIPHSVEKLAKEDISSSVASQHASITPATILRFSTLMVLNGHHRPNKPWASDYLRLTHHGIDLGDPKLALVPAPVRHDLRLCLEPGKMKHLQQHLKHVHDPVIATNATGGLAIRFRTPFGEPFVDQIKKRLSSVERLDCYLAILRKLDFTCTMVSLAKLDFTYRKAPQLSAEVIFASDDGLPVRVRLKPADGNPHQRIKVMLEQGLNKDREDCFATFAHILVLTLPLLQALERLESVHCDRQTMAVHARSATWYSLAYKTPLPQHVFQLRTRCKAQGGRVLVRWHIEDGKSKTTTEDLPKDYLRALKDFWHSKGDHWFGIGNGIITEARGMGEALQKLDEIVRRFETVPEKQKDPDAAVDEGAKPPHHASEPPEPKEQRDVITLD